MSTFVVLFAGIDTNASQEEIQRQVDDLYPLLYILEGIMQFFYNLLCNTIGWSPGKRMLRMRTIDAEGSPPGFRRGLKRTFGAVLSGSLFGLGYAWAVWDREHRTWHDKIAKTYVVRAPNDEHGRPKLATGRAYASQGNERGWNTCRTARPQRARSGRSPHR